MQDESKPAKPLALAFANQKGGQGKTTLSVFTARELAEKRGKRVLFVDLDPQGNSSFSLEKFGCKAAAADFLTRELTDAEREELKNRPGLALLRSDARLANDFNPDVALERWNNNLSGLGFDQVIIDTPPTLGNKLILALIFSRYVIIPAVPDAYAVQGMSLLLQTISHLKEVLGEQAPCEILGIVINNFKRGSAYQRGLLEGIRKQAGRMILRTLIRSRDCVQAAQGSQLSLRELRSPKGLVTHSFREAAAEFAALTDEILKRAKKHGN